METWQIVLAVVLLIVIGGVIVWWLCWPMMTTSVAPSARRASGYSVWRWRAGNWEMIENHSALGHVPGPAPPHPGEFENQNVQVTSVPSTRR
jgi:hypothetical protein